MADITMCQNNKCELKENCYRFTATPNPHRQSYSDFNPVNGKCYGFVRIKNNLK